MRIHWSVKYILCIIICAGLLLTILSSTTLITTDNFPDSLGFTKSTWGFRVVCRTVASAQQVCIIFKITFENNVFFLFFFFHCRDERPCPTYCVCLSISPSSYVSVPYNIAAAAAPAGMLIYFLKS